MVEPRQARSVFHAALALGLVGDHLFRASEWGLNVTLWIALLGVEWLTLKITIKDDKEARAWSWTHWPWLAALFFAVMWVVRDSPLLLAIDLLAVLALLSLPVLQAQGTSLPTAGAIAILSAPIRAGWHAAGDGLRLFQTWRPWPVGGSAVLRNSAAVGLGLILAVPPLLVFGGLFASADPMFGAAVGWIRRIDLGSLPSHIVVSGLLTMGSAGYLWALLHPSPPWPLGLPNLRLGALPVLIVLGATALLFALFNLTQLGSLFGGEAFVQRQTGLTFAEYARHGFAQLSLASALSLPLLYLARFAAGPVGPGGDRALRILLAVQLTLTGLVLASALWRMGLYIRVYGLTEDRLNSSAFMLWIGATMGVFARTVVPGRPQTAAFGSVVAAVIALASLNLANPKALVARYNLANQERRAVDVNHLVSLGGDAVPAVVSGLDRLSPELRCELVHRLTERYSSGAGDWRAWNLARARARRAARSLGSAAASCPAPSNPRPQREG